MLINYGIDMLTFGDGNGPGARRRLLVLCPSRWGWGEVGVRSLSVKRPQTSSPCTSPGGGSSEHRAPRRAMWETEC